MTLDGPPVTPEDYAWTQAPGPFRRRLLADNRNPPYGCGPQVAAVVLCGRDLRRIEAGYALKIERSGPLGIDAEVGPVRHPVGAHALAESPHVVQLGRGRPASLTGLAAAREQVFAGSLGRLELRKAGTELLRGDLREPAASGVGVL